MFIVLRKLLIRRVLLIKLLGVIRGFRPISMRRVVVTLIIKRFTVGMVIVNRLSLLLFKFRSRMVILVVLVVRLIRGPLLVPVPLVRVRFIRLRLNFLLRVPMNGNRSLLLCRRKSLILLVPTRVIIFLKLPSQSTSLLSPRFNLSTILISRCGPKS